MKKTIKKKPVKKSAKKPVKDTFISHFHVANKLALTIVSKETPTPGIYCLGMALVHDNDCGSRKKGRDEAWKKLCDGWDEFVNNQKLYKDEITLPNPKQSWWSKLLRGELPAPELPPNLLTLVNDNGVHGQSGHWLVKDDSATLPPGEKSQIKRLVKFLRNRESADAWDSKYLQKLYRTVFFRLEELIS